MAPSLAQLPQNRKQIARMPYYKVGAVVQKDKSGEAHGFKHNVWLTVTGEVQGTNDNHGVNVKLASFTSKEEADNCADVLRDSVTEDLDETAVQQLLAATEGILHQGIVSKAILQRLTSQWRQAIFVGEGGGEGDSPPPSDPLVGKQVTLALVIKFPSEEKAKPRRLTMTVAALVDDGENYMLENESFEEKITKKFKASTLRQLVDSMPDTLKADAKGYPFPLDAADFSTDFVKIIKALPQSSKLENGSVDARELLLVVKNVEVSSSLLAAVKFTNPGAEDDATAVATLHAAAVSLHNKIKPKAAELRARTWPADPARLGSALGTFLRAGPVPDGQTPAQHPLANAFKGKAEDSKAWKGFLESAFKITAPPDRQAFAESMKKDEYIQMGILQSFLHRGGVHTSAGSIDKLQGGMNTSQLIMTVYDFSAEIERAADSRGGSRHPIQLESGGPSSGSASSGTVPSSNPLARPGGGNIIFDSSKSKFSELDERELSQLNTDAATVAQSKEMLDQLAAFVSLKENGQLEPLEKATRACPHHAVTRLVQYDGKLLEALQGTYPALANTCVALRFALEQRMEEQVMGGKERAEKITERQRKAMRSARLGRLQKLKIFHLIDMDDNGSKEAPLKQLAGWPKDKQLFSLRKAWSMLSKILNFAFPELMAELWAFMDAMLVRLEEVITSGVDNSCINEWVVKIFKKMSAPVKRFIVGDVDSTLTLAFVGIAGTTRAAPAPIFDISWVQQTDDFQSDLRKGELKALSRGNTGESSNASLLERIAILERDQKKKRPPVEDDEEDDANRPAAKGPKNTARPAGSRAGSLVIEDGWLRHGPCHQTDFHLDNCAAKAATFGHVHYCVAVCTAPVRTKQEAAEYCPHGHLLHATEHDAWDDVELYNEIMASRECRRIVQGRRRAGESHALDNGDEEDDGDDRV